LTNSTHIHVKMWTLSWRSTENHCIPANSGTVRPIHLELGTGVKVASRDITSPRGQRSKSLGQVTCSVINCKMVAMATPGA